MLGYKFGYENRESLFIIPFSSVRFTPNLSCTSLLSYTIFSMICSFVQTPINNERTISKFQYFQIQSKRRSQYPLQVSSASSCSASRVATTNRFGYRPIQTGRSQPSPPDQIRSDHQFMAHCATICLNYDAMHPIPPETVSNISQPQHPLTCNARWGRGAQLQRG
jgi:hypothetical protein